MPNIANTINSISQFFKEIKVEVKKVNWPSAKTTAKYTLIVLGVSTATAVFLGGVDYLFTNILNKFIL